MVASTLPTLPAEERFYLCISAHCSQRGPVLLRPSGLMQAFTTPHSGNMPARGLLEDDGEWRICLEGGEAGPSHTGPQLRRLFLTLLTRMIC